MENKINMTKNKLIIIGAIIIFLLAITSVFADIIVTRITNTKVFYVEGNYGDYAPSRWIVTKFVDPDNGNVCYVSKSWGDSRSGGISCIK